jgi:hypothetical protein
MGIEVLIGVGVGILFGVLQILVLKKVTKVLTQDSTKGSKLIIFVAIAQFIAFVAVFVLLGMYSLITVGVAGVTMALTAIFIWILFLKKLH